MRTDTPQLREHLLTAVRCASEALETHALVLLAPPVTESVPGCFATWHTPAWQRRVVGEQCCGTHHLRTRRRYDHEVYLQLRALEGKGLIERIRISGRRNVAWRAVNHSPTARQGEIEALEALFALDAFKGER